VPTLACSILRAHKQEEQGLPDRVGSGLVGLLDEAGTSLERLKKGLLSALPSSWCGEAWLLLTQKDLVGQLPQRFLQGCLLPM